MDPPSLATANVLGMRRHFRLVPARIPQMALREQSAR